MHADSRALLTGRNHHSLGLSAITETSLGDPAHNCFVGHERGFVSEMLLEHGGYALFVDGGRLVHLYNDLAVDRFEVASNIEVPIGDVTLRYESVPAGPIR